MMAAKIFRIGDHWLNLDFVCGFRRVDWCSWAAEEEQPGILIEMLIGQWVQLTQEDVVAAHWPDIDSLINDLANAMDALNG